MTTRHAPRLLTCAAFASLFTGVLGGCAAQRRDAAPEGVGEAGAMFAPGVSVREAARGVTIWRGDGSGRATWEEAARELAGADVVLMGEVHGHTLGNAVQQELYEDILVLNPLAQLSMEFYERDEQVALDDYLAGITDRAAFEKASGRSKGNNPPAHARMIDASREAGRPVIASNAPRRYVRLARTDGYERLEMLGQAQRALLEIPEGTPKGAYRDRFVEAMGGMASHGGEAMIEGFLRSQTVWDATMAQSIVDGLGGGAPVVHVVGYFHAQFGGEPGGSGLVDQLRARGEGELKILSLITLPADSELLRDRDEGLADFVVYVGEDKR